MVKGGLGLGGFSKEKIINFRNRFLGKEWRNTRDDSNCLDWELRTRYYVNNWEIIHENVMFYFTLYFSFVRDHLGLKSIYNLEENNRYKNLAYIIHKDEEKSLRSSKKN